MKTRCMVLVAAIAVLALCAVSARAADFAEKWVMMGGDVSTSQGLERTLALMKEAKDCGCTHILFSDGMMSRLDEATPEYFDNVKKFLAATDEMKLQIVPQVYAIGYSGRYLRRDPNLAAGIPVKNMPFVVQGKTVVPAPSLDLDVVNGGFEKSADGMLTGWTAPKYPGFISTDAVAHSGKASLKVANIDKLPKESGGAISVGQTLKVKPFQYYLVSIYTKAKDLDATGEGYVIVTSKEGKRRNLYTNLGVRDNEEWTKHFTVFNTLDATEVQLSVGVDEAKSGTIWFDDLEIKPAGFMMVVRRDLTPLVVTNEDGSVTYAEGKDFEPIKGMEARQRGRNAIFSQEFRLTEGSRIKDGQTILVSYYHTVLIYGDQLVISMEDPKVFDIMDAQMKDMARIWPTGAYFMNYDEIRIGGWEPQPGGAHLKPGEELAQHVAKGVAIVRKYAPKARIYTWSDMFSPYHNARPFAERGYYYLVNGNWDGSWEGLPKDVIIANWYGKSHESMMFFADRGYKQFICGYYDGDMKENIESWMAVAKGVPNVVGIMYTTWHRNFRDMPEYFRLVKEYPAWVKVESTESLLKEK